MDHVQKGISAKKSLEEILKIEAIPGFPDHVSSGQVLTLAGVLTAAYKSRRGSLQRKGSGAFAPSWRSLMRGLRWRL